MWFRVVLVALMALTAAACQVAKADPAAETAARAIFDDLRLGRTENLKGRLPPTLQAEKPFQQVLVLRRFIPPSTPHSAKLVGVRVAEMKGRGRYEWVSMEYDYGDQVTLFQTRFFQRSGAKDWAVAGFRVNTEKAARLAANRFTLSGKPIPGLIFLAYAAITLPLMIAALVKVVLTPGLKRKWLWAPLCFVGVFTLRMNWTTGLLAINWLSVQLVGVGIGAGASRFDPWIITATLPIGALLVLGGLWANPLFTRRASA